MRAIRVSATDIDAFRRFRADEDSDLPDFLAQMRRTFEPTEPMMAGSALHAALETIQTGDHPTLESAGYTFTFSADVEVDLPSIRELKATKEYTFPGCVATLVGKVDAVHGRRIDDHKFTARYDAERFLNSYQWRIYLDIFGADEFRWNVFEGRETGPKQYLIFAAHLLRTHRYPCMGADVERELRHFIDFAGEHLPERFTEAVL